jgi:hypothetical protein
MNPYAPMMAYETDLSGAATISWTAPTFSPCSLNTELPRIERLTLHPEAIAFASATDIPIG